MSQYTLSSKTIFSILRKSLRGTRLSHRFARSPGNYDDAMITIYIIGTIENMDPSWIIQTRGASGKNTERIFWVHCL